MNKLFKFIESFLKGIYSILIGIFKTVTIDLYKNIKTAFVYSFKPEERKKMKRELESEKKIELVDERLKRIERILYSLNEDVEYLKSDKGKFDMKELRKEVK